MLPLNTPKGTGFYLVLPVEIRYRHVGEVLEHKIIYDRPDKDGFLGCRGKNAFLTKEEAVKVFLEE